jgi:hercynine metabolism protein
MSATNWLDDLEAQLEARLERFLQSNPQQQTLLEEQHRRERQTRLLEQRLTLQQQAQQQRQGLLRMAGEIRQWQERVERARRAGASDLAVRAESHIASLMEQGRQRWQNLGELGQRFQAVEQELNQLTGASGSASPPSPDLDLDTAWSHFEAQQELEELRRRQRN